MNIVLDRTSSSKRSKSNLQARFDKLQQQLLKQQKLNQKFKAELDELVRIYPAEVSRMDRELVTPLTQSPPHPLTFTAVKASLNGIVTNSANG